MKHSWVATEHSMLQVLVSRDKEKYPEVKSHANLGESKTRESQSAPGAPQQSQSRGLEMVTVSLANAGCTSQGASNETVHALAVELAATRSRAAYLTEENERLMDLSSKLRAEWERTLTAAARNRMAPLQIMSQDIEFTPICHWQAAVNQIPVPTHLPGSGRSCQPWTVQHPCHLRCMSGVGWADCNDQGKENKNILHILPNDATEIPEVGVPSSCLT